MGPGAASDSTGSPSDFGEAVERFCCQYLQLESSLDYPDGQALKRPEAQDEIFDRIFAGAPPRKSARFQLRVLKELVQRIQDSISEDEADDFEVSDKLMDRLGELMLEPLMSEAEEAQRKCLVTYRLSLIEPPEHIDILENRSLLAAGGTTGLRTWEAALHLGQYLSINSHLVSGRRVLELGAGTGYLSILCAKALGAAHVTASDGSGEVVENLADNLALNGLEWDYNVSSSARLNPKLLKWGHALVGTEEPEWNGGRKIDLVIGADVTYDHKVIPFLVSTLAELVELDTDTEIIISATQRNADTLMVFRDGCAKSGLQVKQVELSVEEQTRTLKRHGRPHGILTPFYSRQVPIHIFHIHGQGR